MANEREVLTQALEALEIGKQYAVASARQFLESSGINARVSDDGHVKEITAAISTLRTALAAEQPKTDSVHFVPSVEQAVPAEQGDACDAARYRWLRDSADCVWYPPGYNGNPNTYWQIEFLSSVSESLDAAIDAALQSTSEGKQ